jgi:hypothetical protein
MKLCILGLLLVIGPAVSCKIIPLDESPTPPLEQLSIGTTDISNWQPQASMTVYVGTDLYNFNDGGATKYLDKKCLKTGVQTFEQNSEIVKTMVMDFGTNENATAMYTEEQLDNAGSTLKDPVFPDSTAFFTSNLGGGTTYAHFDNFYIEIAVAGFSDQSLAMNTADMFLGLYEKKIGM